LLLGVDAINACDLENPLKAWFGELQTQKVLRVTKNEQIAARIPGESVLTE
jgi:hypothetical protein